MYLLHVKADDGEYKKDFEREIVMEGVRTGSPGTQRLSNDLSEIKAVYEKFSHLDKLISDPILLDGDDKMHKILYEVWMAVKNILGIKNQKIGEKNAELSGAEDFGRDL